MKNKQTNKKNFGKVFPQENDSRKCSLLLFVFCWENLFPKDKHMAPGRTTGELFYVHVKIYEKVNHGIYTCIKP